MQRATPPPIEWLVQGLFPRAASLMVFSEEGIGKSLMAYDLAFAIATGQLFLGLPCLKGKVLYFDEENSRAIAAERVWGFAHGRNVGIEDLRANFHLRLGALYGKWGIQLHDEVVREKPALVVIDTFSALLPGLAGAENDNALMKRLLMLLRQAVIRACPTASLLMLHHDSKNLLTSGRPRGASAIAGDVDGSWIISLDRAPSGQEPARLLIPKKVRILSSPPPIMRMELSKFSDGVFKLGGSIGKLPQ